MNSENNVSKSKEDESYIPNEFLGDDDSSFGGNDSIHKSRDGNRSPVFN
jgi:hypothetical protein